LRSLVLKHIPVFDENSIQDAEDIRRDPALWPAMSREASVDDHEVPLGHDHAGLIFQRRRNVLDQTEETIAAGLDMSAVLDVVGRPVALSFPASASCRSGAVPRTTVWRLVEIFGEIQQSSALHHVRTDASFFRSMD